MAKKQKRPTRGRTYLLRHARAMMDQIESRLPGIESTAHSEQQILQIKDIRKRILTWPRSGANVSKERKKEIQKEGSCIINDFNRHLSDLDEKGPVLIPRKSWSSIEFIIGGRVCRWVFWLTSLCPHLEECPINIHGIQGLRISWNVLWQANFWIQRNMGKFF